jgi:hypothetical protein
MSNPVGSQIGKSGRRVLERYDLAYNQDRQMFSDLWVLWTAR